MSDSVLVIGGGIAGVQASLDLAEAGAKVILVERGPSIGGKMAALDKNFPTLDCSVCIEAPKLSEVGEHPNIEILNNAEVVQVDGEAGAFRTGIRQRGGLRTSGGPRRAGARPPQGMHFSIPTERHLERQAGAIIASAGFDTIDPSLLGQFGYGSHPDVLTAMEFERLLPSARPPGGEVVRPSDGEHPESILF